jgi:hypothetical protein
MWFAAKASVVSGPKFLVTQAANPGSSYSV